MKTEAHQLSGQGTTCTQHALVAMNGRPTEESIVNRAHNEDHSIKARGPSAHLHDDHTAVGAVVRRSHFSANARAEIVIVVFHLFVCLWFCFVLFLPLIMCVWKFRIAFQTDTCIGVLLPMYFKMIYIFFAAKTHDACSESEQLQAKTNLILVLLVMPSQLTNPVLLFCYS